jgi:hypothetical protein
MTAVDRAINIDDLKRLAKRRLPKIMFDFIEGGVEDEVGLREPGSLSARRTEREGPRNARSGEWSVQCAASAPPLLQCQVAWAPYIP